MKKFVGNELIEVKGLGVFALRLFSPYDDGYMIISKDDSEKTDGVYYIEPAEEGLYIVTDNDEHLDSGSVYSWDLVTL